MTKQQSGSCLSGNWERELQAGDRRKKTEGHIRTPFLTESTSPPGESWCSSAWKRRALLYLTLFSMLQQHPATLFLPGPLLHLEYSSTAPWSSFPYSTRLSTGINSPWKLHSHDSSLNTRLIRHLFSMLISTTPFTIVFVIVWLSIFFLHLTVSFLRARTMSYFSYLLSYSLC